MTATRTLARILLLSSLLTAAAASAQMHRVEQPKKVTRAVGVYEWVGSLEKPDSARLVPVSVFINGQMQDGGTYLAQPVPLALDTGNVYAIEKAGVPLGTLEIKLARDVATTRDVADDNPDGVWYGYGLFAPPAKPKPSKLKPSVQIAGIEDTGDDRPHFVAMRPQKPETSSKGKSTTDDNDPERPTLGRRNGNGAEDADKAEQERRHRREHPQGYVTGMPIGFDDPDRPVLERGRAAPAAVPQLEGLPASMEQAAAVSDPSEPEPHDFALEWDSPGEQTATLAEMEKLAAAQARAYMQANGLIVANSADEGPSTPPRLVRTPHGIPSLKASKTSKAALSAPLKLSDGSLKAYELSYGGLPTFVYSAQLTVAPAKAQTERLTAYVVVVAQRLPEGNLQTSLTSVTDSAHLNRQPWMRFIDVVDPDGSHRGSLLFELRAAHSRQFALYGLTSAAAQQTFATAVLE